MPTHVTVASDAGLPRASDSLPGSIHVDAVTVDFRKRRSAKEGHVQRTSLGDGCVEAEARQEAFIACSGGKNHRSWNKGGLRISASKNDPRDLTALRG